MRRKTEAGQALAFTAVALVALLGFAGLAVDMGMLRYEKRLQQTAADAAAIAGASNLPPAFGGPGSSAVTAAAQDASATNGFTDSSSNTGCPNAIGCVTVTANNPPLSGPHTGNSAYVEVLVTAVHPTYFMKALGNDQEAVTARAVATNVGGGGAGDACFTTLGPPTASIEGVNINGSATLNASTCGIADNGNFNTQGNKLVVNANTFGVSGGWNSSGPGGTVTCQADVNCPSSPMPAATDPLQGLASPCSQGFAACTVCPQGSGCTVTDPVITINGGSTCGTGCSFDGSTYTISPGTYSSITISGAGSTPNVVFKSGTYIIDGVGNCTSAGLGCFNETGNATITGNGVMFYFINNSTVNITGTPNLTLTAQSSGTYAGILMYQAPVPCGFGISACVPIPCVTNTPCDVNVAQNSLLTGDTGPILGGNSGSNYGGMLYFPSDQLTFFGNNTSFSIAKVISYSATFSGNPTVNMTGSGGMPSGVDLVKVATLVE